MIKAAAPLCVFSSIIKHFNAAIFETNFINGLSMDDWNEKCTI